MSEDEISLGMPADPPPLRSPGINRFGDDFAFSVNSSCESFNARFRDELLNGEIFHTLKEARVVIEEWRRHYNTVRPHSALGWKPPAPEAIVPMDQRPVMH